MEGKKTRADILGHKLVREAEAGRCENREMMTDATSPWTGAAKRPSQVCDDSCGEHDRHVVVKNGRSN